MKKATVVVFHKEGTNIMSERILKTIVMLVFLLSCLFPFAFIFVQRKKKMDEVAS